MARATDPQTADALAPSGALPVRNITVDDLRGALMRGLEDFREVPTHSLFLGVFYGLVGLLIFDTVVRANLLQLAFPLVAGFSLVGPLAALGLNELSRRRERGLDASRWRMFSVVRSPALGSILVLGLVLLVIFSLWVEVASVIFGATFGNAPLGFGTFLTELFTTAHGWALIILGNAAGAVFAAVVFAISVISFPLLLDRNVGVSRAVQTSVAAIRQNPRTMGIWGLIIIAGFVIGCVPFFLGLAIVFPILGHAGWHLYRAVVV